MLTVIWKGNVRIKLILHANSFYVIALIAEIYWFGMTCHVTVMSCDCWLYGLLNMNLNYIDPCIFIFAVCSSLYVSHVYIFLALLYACQIVIVLSVPILLCTNHNINILKKKYISQYERPKYENLLKQNAS